MPSHLQLVSASFLVLLSYGRPATSIPGLEERSRHHEPVLEAQGRERTANSGHVREQAPAAAAARSGRLSAPAGSGCARDKHSTWTVTRDALLT